MNKKLLTLFALIVFVFSCSNDTVEFKKKDILGFWELVEAKRNGNKTDLLRGGYFYFGSTGKMATNFKGDTLNELFEVEGELIKTLGPENMTFKVKYISKDTLKLTSKIGKSNFDFMGVRFKERR